MLRTAFSNRILSSAIAACGALAATLVAHPAMASTTTVTQLVAAPATGVWTLETTGTTPGTGAITSLTGLGGNLENNQPLPTGAVKLTTGADGGDRANVFLRQDFGAASTFLTTATLGYSYFKTAVGDPAPAPSMKLEVFSSVGTGDNFGTLIYEPYLQGTGNPSTGDWQNVAISPTTGSGVTSTGGWWWSGGFEQPSSAGSPPYRSLTEWAALFASSDPTDFATARVVGLGVGVGSNNLNQVGYFDKVSYQVGTAEANVYDFEPAGAVPLPASAWAGLVLLAGLVGAKGLKHRRGQGV